MIMPSERFSPADASKAVTSDYIKALNLNNKIIVSAQLAQQNLYEMCTALKEMRDGKLYKELGYAIFEEYCENEVGLKRRQAYKYISVVENLPQDFVQSTAQIGSEKLYMLASLDEEQRTEITANVDVESATVKELKEQIERLKKDKAYFEARTDDLRNVDCNYKKLQDDYNKLGAKLSAQIGENNALNDDKRELERKIQELESRPVEVATQIVEKIPDDYVTRQAYEEMVCSYTAQLDKADEEFVEEKRRAYEKEQQLEKKISELEDAPRENSDEVFDLLCQMCRHPLSRLALFVSDHPLYRERLQRFIEDNTEIIEEE